MDPFYLAILFYFAAFVLATLDIFLPSGGMLLILCLASSVASVLFGFRSGNTLGMIMLTLVVASVPVFVFLAIKIWPNTPMGRRIILGLPQQAAAERKATANADNAIPLGKVFLADSPLMPTGYIKMGYRHVNAIAEVGIIEAGQHVEVVAFRNRAFIVRATDAPLTSSRWVVPPSAGSGGPALVGPAAESQRSGNLLDLPAEELGLDSLDD